MCYIRIRIIITFTLVITIIIYKIIIKIIIITVISNNRILTYLNKASTQFVNNKSLNVQYANVSSTFIYVYEMYIVLVFITFKLYYVQEHAVLYVNI